MKTKDKILWPLALVGLAVTIFLWNRGAAEQKRLQSARVAAQNGGTVGRTNLPHHDSDRSATPVLPNGASRADPTTTALAKQLGLLTKESDPGVQSAALVQLVDGMPLTDAPAALIASLGMTNRISSEFRQMLVRRWTMSDAPGAAEWVERNLAAGARTDALTAVASAWAESDAAGAEQWARRLMDPDERGAALLAVAGEMTAKNPSSALALAVDLPPGLARDEFLLHAAGEWAGQDSKSAIEWGQQIQNEALRAQMLAAISTGFAEKDPAAAATFAATALPAGRAQDDAIVGVVQRWVQQDPAQAAAWVAAFPEGPLRDTALEAVVKLWADRDITEAGVWINTLSERSGSDVAIATYVEKMAVQFPEMAVEWAQEIRNPALRNERLVDLAELWLHNDAAAARLWIAQSPLSEEIKTRLLAPKQN